jgi:hypothetical protein
VIAARTARSKRATSRLARDAGRAAALASGVLALAGSWGCARRAPPSGGPLDLEPPFVVSSTPDSGAAGVARDARLSVTFSENMEPRSAGESVALAPRVEIKQRRWSGRTMTVVLAESLRAAQVYTLFLGTGARDAHGNTMASGKTVVFTTGDSFPSGAIEGSIEARGFTAPGTYLWCYDAATGHVPDSTARDFDAVGVADKLGSFRVAGLAVPGRYRLWAFADLNSNRSYEPSTDILEGIDTVLVLSRDRPVARDLKLSLVNPRAPGRVRGTVVDSLADSLGVLRVLVYTASDSIHALEFSVDSDGGFDFKLIAGEYRVRAYRDLDRNHYWLPEKEPSSDPLPVVVPPGADVLDVRLRLRPPRGRP